MCRTARILVVVTAALLLALGGSLPAEAKYAAIVIDAATGEVLHAENADVRNYPASITKMMTLYLTFEALREGRLSLKQKLPVSRRAAGQAPSKLGLKPGSTIQVEHAILALVTKSANDVATVLAEALGGTEAKFARQMTAKARALGMRNTTFRNASGLPDRGQLSTARDMAMLARALIYDFPEYYSYFSRKTFTYRGVTYRNHNRLMSRYHGMDGLKTGYIRASGFNLAASAVRHNRRLIAVVFGGRSSKWRDAHMEKLLDRAFARVKDLPPVQMASARPSTMPPLPPRKPGTATALAAELQDGLDRNGLEALVDAASRTLIDPPRLGLIGTAHAAVSDDGADRPGDVGQGDISRDDAAPSGWGIQVGAFRDAEASQRALAAAAAQLPELLGGAQAHIARVETDRGPLFRARLLGLEEAAAKRACARLERAGQSCLTVPPSARL